jgi:hypothetical protein
MDLPGGTVSDPTTATGAWPGTAARAQHGSALAALDYDGDGCDDLAASAPRESLGARLSGTTTIALSPFCPGGPDADADADAEVDGDESERIGMAGRSGSGIATAGGYSGTEEQFFIADEGEGEAICRITYSLTSTSAPAEGCDACRWAFELVIADAAVAEERDVGCLATLGIDPARVGDLDGTHVYYGYDPAYMGHGSVLVSRMESGLWAPECYATWDEASGAFSYRRIDGFPPY